MNRGTLWRQENKERANETARAWYKKNKESCNRRSAEWLTRNPEYAIWHTAKQRASKSGIEFSIEVSDIVIPERCSYLDVPISYRNGASLDRIDNSKGYVKGNIEVISLKANRMKSNATKEELILFAKRVLHE